MPNDCPNDQIDWPVLVSEKPSHCVIAGKHLQYDPLNECWIDEQGITYTLSITSRLKDLR